METIDPKILAMYLGLDAETPHRHYPDPTKKSVHKVGKLMDYDLVLGQFGVWFPDEEKENLVNFYPQDLKPILRPLSSMTEEEQEEYNKRKQRKGFMAQVHADNTLWLLSRGFDLFGLIDKGLAIKKP